MKVDPQPSTLTSAVALAIRATIEQKGIKQV